MMAKRSNEQQNSADKGGMRILYVELNGSNSSLQEGLRTLVAAMNKPVQVAAPTSRRIVANQDPEPEPNTSDMDAEPSHTEDNADAFDPAFENSSENIPSGSTRRKRGEGASRDRNASLAIVPSLNLHPQDRASLKAFAGERRSKTQEEHIAVYIYYLDRILQESDIGFSHIFTCFKETGKKMPIDVAQSCRNAGKKGWITVTNGLLKGTTRGDNFVEQELPRRNAETEVK